MAAQIRAAAPGTREGALTDDQGHFHVQGLVRASLVVTADHARFMPTSLAPMEPGGPPIRIVLVPAFLATFRVRTSDGGEPKNPSLAWRATGRGPESVRDRFPTQRRRQDALRRLARETPTWRPRPHCGAGD